jgi:hypothetical protein
VASLIDSIGSRRWPSPSIGRAASGQRIALLLDGSDAGTAVLSDHEQLRRARQREHVETVHRIAGRSTKGLPRGERLTQALRALAANGPAAPLGAVARSMQLDSTGS